MKGAGGAASCPEAETAAGPVCAGLRSQDRVLWPVEIPQAL